MMVEDVGLTFTSAFVPAFTSALIAYGCSLVFGIAPTHFALTAPELNVRTALLVILLGVACAAVSRLFCYTLHFMEHTVPKLLPNPWVRVFAGGVLVIGFSYLFGVGRYNGAGMSVITAAVEQGQALPWDFLCKIFLTALTLAVGFKGGEVVPSFYIGATFGCIAGPWLGLPAGFQNAIFAIANLFIQAGVNSFDSLMVKGNSAAANADAMIYDCMAAFYMACASFMSQNYGAGKPDRVKKSYFISLAYSFGVGLALGGGLFLFGRQFLALFTTEGAVIDAGMKRVGVMGFAYCISAFMDCTIAASRGLGKTVVPTVIVVLGSCVFRVIWVYTIFAHFHTIPSLYLLYPCSWTLTAIAEIVYFIHAYKDSMKIFTQPQPAEV